VPKAGRDKELCGAQRYGAPKGALCRQRAGWGTDHPGIGRCKRHGGKTPSHQAHAQVEIIKRTADRLGVPRDVEPSQGILEMVCEAAGNVEFYRQLVADLPTHPKDDTLTIEDDEPHWQRGDPGIYGRTYHQSGIPTGEAKRHILVQMYDEERDRLERYIKDALAAKVDERRVVLAEAEAKELFAAVGAAMTQAQLTPEQAEAFRRALAINLRNAQPAAIAR
jgi:hypothetical protein